VAVDRQGLVFVADHGIVRIHKFDSNGRFLTAWGGRGSQAGEFWAPVGVAIGPAGHVYVIDAGRVQVFTDTGVVVGAWRNASVIGGEFVLAGIAVDDQGAIYVTDQARHRIVKFRPRQPWPTPVAIQPTRRTAVPGLTQRRPRRHWRRS
jgi:DNA-binding beta-propeller fold protein YncE